MADEITKVITVDVSDSLDSLDEMREKVVSAGYSFSSLKSAKKYKKQTLCFYMMWCSAKHPRFLQFF